MDILTFLKTQKMKLENVNNPEDLDELIDQLKNVSDRDIVRSVNKENIEEINKLIGEILHKIEQLKKDTLNEMKLSGEKVKGVKAYLKNI